MVVSTLPVERGMQYRIVGDEQAIQQIAGATAAPAEPGLEDGYVWLMREQRTQMKRPAH
jgi:ABC-2 type transport system ATP-binding protein